jgi:hypothetical protein
MGSIDSARLVTGSDAQEIRESVMLSLEETKGSGGIG